MWKKKKEKKEEKKKRKKISDANVSIKQMKRETRAKTFQDLELFGGKKNIYIYFFDEAIIERRSKRFQAELKLLSKKLGRERLIRTMVVRF